MAWPHLGVVGDRLPVIVDPGAVEVDPELLQVLLLAELPHLAGRR